MRREDREDREKRKGRESSSPNEKQGGSKRSLLEEHVRGREGMVLRTAPTGKNEKKLKDAASSHANS